MMGFELDIEWINKLRNYDKKSFSSANPNLLNALGEKCKQQGGNCPDSDTVKSSPENMYNHPLLIEVEKKIISTLDSKLVESIKNLKDLKKYIEHLVDSISNQDYPSLTNKEKVVIIQSLIDEIVGYGPLQTLLQDSLVSEIMVNGYDKVYVERNGSLELTEVKFRDNLHVMQVIDKIVSPLGRRIDDSSPMVDARLPDGSRVNAIISPVSIKGPVLTIRKFFPKPISIKELISYGTLTERMAEFLEMSVLAKCNIIVAGGTGSGKTTLLNVLSSFIPARERIITIEDSAELQLMQPHVISLESRPHNIEGSGEVTIRDLLKNSLRMRPDRIIIGEVRGAEALDMLQAMNTGHNGSLSTIHANSPKDALSRIETMVLYSGIDFPLKAVSSQISSAIELVVFVERLADGTRKITRISELAGMEGDTINTQDIFYYEKKGKKDGKVIGEFNISSEKPKINGKFEAMGINIQG